jgi:hypothetical protein
MCRLRKLRGRIGFVHNCEEFDMSTSTASIRLLEYRILQLKIGDKNPVDQSVGLA